MNKMDGMNYAPQGMPKPVVKPGEFVFSAAHIDHGHIYGMCNGLTEAGGTLKYVYDPDPKKVAAFLKAYPQAKPAASLDQVLEDRETQMVCSSNVTSERGPLGVKAMDAGKDYFVVTSNCDRQIMRAGFPADRFFEIQGNYDDFGCSARCGVPSWDNHDDIQRALAGIDHESFECREETIPKCPVCGADARLCFRHSGHWDEDNARYQRFIEEHSTGKLLLLEMGVGLSTPGVIRTPFQRLTTNLEGAFLVRVILAYEGQPVFNWAGKIPESLAGKSLSVNADACKLVTALLSMRE